MSLDQKTLNELKEKLIQERERIKEELSRIAKPTKDANDYNTTFNNIGDDEDENASEVEEYTDNLALENVFEKQLKEITEALEKIELGTYGKCENCQADIAIERLRAYPAAKICFNC